METTDRTPFQGVTNIIRFNWHFYAAALVIGVSVLVAGLFFDSFPILPSVAVAAIVLLSTTTSLLVSYWIYDHSSLYRFDWMNHLPAHERMNIVNIHAGFDETSAIIHQRFRRSDLQVLDFYDPSKHTEVSIERARKAYPPFPGTVKATTSRISMNEKSADLIFNIFSLHEVRDRNERIEFMRLQASLLKKGGKCVIMEHLRDVPNFLAYNIGSLHFFSDKEWQSNISAAGFGIERTFRVTPFIIVYILVPKHGNTP